MFSREHKRNSEVKKGGGRDPLRVYHADSRAELRTVGEQHLRLFSRASERLTSTHAQTRRRVDASHFSTAAPTVWTVYSRIFRAVAVGR